MSKFEKLIAKIVAINKDMRFNELKKVLEFYGYTMHEPKSGSSHYVFRKSNKYPITIPKHEPIKKVYVEKVKHAIEEEMKHEKH